LWYDTADELGLNVIRMPYTIEGVEYYYDLGRETDFKRFYNSVRKGNMASTSALNPAEYIRIFEPFFAAGDEILYVAFSHAMSGTFQFMRAAVDELSAKYPAAKFTVFDTNNISLGAGLSVLAAGRMHRDGASVAEIVAELTKMRDKAQLWFTVDDLFHLKRGGRLSATSAVIGSILKVKPLLCIGASGKVEQAGKAKGRLNAINLLIDKALEIGVDARFPVYVLDADAADRDSVLETVRERLSGTGAQIVPQTVGPVIGTHCGPGMAGLAYVSLR
jgi:DegV family protein with EDD domain